MKKNPKIAQARAVDRGVAAAFAAGLLAPPILYAVAPMENTVVTVMWKEEQISRTGERLQAILTDKSKIFTVEDDMFRRHFESAAVYREMREHCRYYVTYRGVSLPSAKIYPNIIGFHHVPTDACPTNRPQAPSAGRNQ